MRELCPSCGSRLPKQHGSLCKQCLTDKCDYIPTPEQIAAGCAEVRAARCSAKAANRELRDELYAPAEFPCLGGAYGEPLRPAERPW